MTTKNTFGSHLKHFALSTDIIDDATFANIGRLVHEYVRDELDIDYFKLQVSSPVDRKPGLRTLWSSHAETGSKSVFDDDDQYRDQTAFAFDTGRPLWVVAHHRGKPVPLAEAEPDGYVDQWSGHDGLPRYNRPVTHFDEPRRTSIIVPVCSQGMPIGVLFLESGLYLAATEVAKQELALLAETVGILHRRTHSTSSWRSDTGAAIENLRELLASGTLQRMAKPHVFFAFGKRAPTEVRDAVDQMLRAYGDRVEYEPWDEIPDPGKVTVALERRLSKSRFGLCYLTDPDDAPDAPHRFRYNPNVMFEAGMLHALTMRVTDDAAGWIPIREADAPPPPFDVATQRTIIVPRDGDGALLDDEFEEMFRKHFDALLAGG